MTPTRCHQRLCCAYRLKIGLLRSCGNSSTAAATRHIAFSRAKTDSILRPVMPMLNQTGLSALSAPVLDLRRALMVGQAPASLHLCLGQDAMLALAECELSQVMARET
eukprot:g13645.t1